MQTESAEARAARGLATVKAQYVCTAQKRQCGTAIAIAQPADVPSGGNSKVAAERKSRRKLKKVLTI